VLFFTDIVHRFGVPNCVTPQVLGLHFGTCIA
jgi:hypothetical protein